jgi:hypothetical protein
MPGAVNDHLECRLWHNFRAALKFGPVVSFCDRHIARPVNLMLKRNRVLLKEDRKDLGCNRIENSVFNQCVSRYQC